MSARQIKPTKDLLERTVLRRVTLRLIPFLCVLYFVNILDRVNTHQRAGLAGWL